MAGGGFGRAELLLLQAYLVVKTTLKKIKLNFCMPAGVTECV